jgi:hypothetical protein
MARKRAIWTVTTRAMVGNKEGAMVTAWAMETATRMVGNDEGDGLQE